MTLFLRIRKFLVGYKKAPNAMGCKFCVYEGGLVRDSRLCSKFRLLVEPDHRCRYFSLWSKALEIYGDEQPL